MTSSHAHTARTLIAFLILFMALPLIHAQNQGRDKGDLDSYEWRVSGAWWYSHPGGSFYASADQLSFDIDKDLRFGSYSTFTGTLDWHFKRKHHFTFSASPVYSSNSVTLARDITFQGVTYDLGATVATKVDSLAFAVGYQWDFIRRKQGYVALGTSFNLLDTSASLTGTGSIDDVSATRTASASLFAPLPVLGPKARWYPIHDSKKLSFDGSVQGMYFFGYGDFLSAQGSTQIALHRNLNFKAGYQMGTRLSVHGNTKNIGLRLTQEGPVVGLEWSR